MKRILLLFLLLPILGTAQIQYKTVDSEILNESRSLMIQLPASYEQNTDKSYPVIITMDGEYLFELVAGNVNYYSYWDEMPEVIVVGINQKNSRKKDVTYDADTNLPKDDSADFYEFLGGELLPLIDKNYRTVPLDILVGFDMTANFINYYLLKENKLFQGFINISPDYAEKMPHWIHGALAKSQQKIWYYLATGTEDASSLRKKIIQFDKSMDSLPNPKTHYAFDDFKNARHYTLPGRAIPKALTFVFSAYSPITTVELSKLEKEDQSPFDYLVDKYETIKNQYKLDIKTKIQDYLSIASAIEKTEKWEDYKKLSKRAAKEYPNKILAPYFKGRYYESTGKYRRAIKTFKKAYGYDNVQGLTGEMALHRMKVLQQDFGN